MPEFLCQDTMEAISHDLISQNIVLKIRISIQRSIGDCENILVEISIKEKWERGDLGRVRNVQDCICLFGTGYKINSIID